MFDDSTYNGDGDAIEADTMIDAAYKEDSDDDTF